MKKVRLAKLGSGIVAVYARRGQSCKRAVAKGPLGLDGPGNATQPPSPIARLTRAPGL